MIVVFFGSSWQQAHLLIIFLTLNKTAVGGLPSGPFPRVSLAFRVPWRFSASPWL
jgi:hypothetical protein